MKRLLETGQVTSEHSGAVEMTQLIFRFINHHKKLITRIGFFSAAGFVTIVGRSEIVSVALATTKVEQLTSVLFFNKGVSLPRGETWAFDDW
jgi:hypothetical protein